ncbi:lipase family protein [Antrihabitans cavernicola]|uniref:Lipase n=1 Tax=Antrihabitans cavernicola TaxID=2495913 RepID=A0A5A7S2A2_9NOCA|nr:lipase family protein [Spelaeibacter cavernicola]KAA0017057.1 lipase [Spelaeibacter cavernicola]
MSLDATAEGVGWATEPTRTEHHRPGRPLLPENDPFYVPPTGFAATAPGTLLRSRKVKLGAMGLVPQKITAWQLLYRSNDLNGTPDATVTTVMLPAGADPAKPLHLLSYQCAIDAVTSRAMPSHSLQRGAKFVGAAPQLEFLLIAGALARGWAVSIPDHEGTEGHWGAPREPGYRVLDGIRAALDFEPLGLARDTKVGIWGYSGGGLATSWAAEMAPEYAPELDIVGAALGSPVGDPGSTFLRLNGTAFAGLPALVIAGLRRVYPDLDRVIRQHSSMAGQSLMKAIESMSTIEAIRKFDKYDMGDFIDIPFADLLALPEVVHVIDDIQVGLIKPAAPLFVVQSVNDQIISVDDVDGQVNRYQAAGAHVTYIRDRISGHLTMHPISTPVTLKWLDDRFAGKPLPADSTTTVLSSTLSPSAVLGLLEMGWVAAKVALGRSF